MRSLVELAEGARQEGDLDTAEARFARARAAQPRALAPHLGLAAVARARGEARAARRHAEEALSLDPEDADARLALALALRAEGNVDGALDWLERALRSDPDLLAAHRARAELTGPADRGPLATAEAAVALASAHPYDPWARLQAARALEASGRRRAALSWLEPGLWCADWDPRSALALLRLRTVLAPQAPRGRVVAVHVFADESVRRDPDWRMRMRAVWARTSLALAPLLDTTFLPVSFAPFSSRGASDLLGAIDEAFLRTATPPPSGLVAGFTERAAPLARGTWRLGQAEFLGRRILVRIAPGGLEDDTLLHELLHLYGAVHVAADEPSIMNAQGASRRLDAANRAIVGLLRGRDFGPGGLRANVLAGVDRDALVGAYSRALALNLHFRRLGVVDALEAGEHSRAIASQRIREALSLDPHLGDVAVFVGRLLEDQGRYASSARLFEAATAFYGPQSRAGRRARRDAERLWDRARRAFGGAGEEREGGS